MGFGPDLSLVWNTLLHSQHVMSILLIFDVFQTIFKLLVQFFLVTFEFMIGMCSTLCYIHKLVIKESSHHWDSNVAGGHFLKARIFSALTFLSWALLLSSEQISAGHKKACKFIFLLSAWDWKVVYWKMEVVKSAFRKLSMMYHTTWLF